jgi:anti-sigma factor RsiW
MHTEFTDQLSVYLDGELPAEHRAALEAHLASCVACRGVLDDLKAIVTAAPSYEGSLPDHDLWPAIRNAIDESREVTLPAPVRTRRARVFSLPQLVAASVAFAVLTGGGVYAALRYWTPVAPPAPSPAVQAATPAPGLAVIPAGARASEVYREAIGDLERVLVEGRDRLDPATLRVIEDNLRIIDRAIAEARAAIAASPANGYLSARVADNMRRKLVILRTAADAIAASES